MSADRLGGSLFFLAGIGLLTGFAGVLLAAHSIADPLEDVRRAVAAVGEGHTDVHVPVTAASEVGLLQAGFNRMVGGLREREGLRDLFGRQVGEDVARQALERGVELGGEELDVAVLLIDPSAPLGWPRTARRARSSPCSTSSSASWSRS